jgi:hypothetical protein
LSTATPNDATRLKGDLVGSRGGELRVWDCRLGPSVGGVGSHAKGREPVAAGPLPSRVRRARSEAADSLTALVWATGALHALHALQHELAPCGLDLEASQASLPLLEVRPSQELAGAIRGHRLETLRPISTWACRPDPLTEFPQLVGGEDVSEAGELRLPALHKPLDGLLGPGHTRGASSPTGAAGLSLHPGAALALRGHPASSHAASLALSLLDQLPDNGEVRLVGFEPDAVEPLKGFDLIRPELEFLAVFEGQPGWGFVKVLNHGSTPASPHPLTVLARTGALCGEA